MRRRALLAGTAALGSTLLLSACSVGRAGNTIIDIARATPDLSTFVSAIEAVGLAETLDGPGPFTVFAPTNAAFAALPDGQLAALLQPENRRQLINLLTYHALAGANPSAQFAGTRRNVPTLQGQTVLVDGTGGTVRVNDATVVRADIVASNGILHIVNRVILPA
ncbi:fasciclin domain-containing protein [Palleronia sp. KMU-117]|uniref:fasciclin domain-containing protein n=1 Tax=Palleronia sp. KMU-117 TaxID=3434108 RepID=UPI003D707056